MKILVVGGGGREHALVWRLAQDRCEPTLFCAPGNAGTTSLATNLPIAAEDIPGLLAWAQEHRPDLTMVGPEVPLCLGIVDAFAAEGLRVFGPCQAAAKMEGSKRFAKEVMVAAGVPTARSMVFDSYAAAETALAEFSLPVVIKADGLAAGKGVVIAQTHAEAVSALHAMLEEAEFGQASSEVLIEEFLEGEEASILALVDGEHAVLLPASQDHKRAFDGDQGPNTGGMGAYSPAPVMTGALLASVKERVILPVVRELKKRGIVYKGVLYAGLMLTARGMYVLEFNARFGDPETEAVLPRIGGDLIPALEACIDGTLHDGLVAVRTEAAATVILASGGYPGAYKKGLPITGLDAVSRMEDCVVFHAGTTCTAAGEVVTSGGRVLAVTALGSDLQTAVAHAYEAIGRIHFEGMHFRSDIAHRAFGRD